MPAWDYYSKPADGPPSCVYRDFWLDDEQMAVYLDQCGPSVRSGDVSEVSVTFYDGSTAVFTRQRPA